MSNATTTSKGNFQWLRSLNFFMKRHDLNSFYGRA
mgnify:CR=1 FL=1